MIRASGASMLVTQAFGFSIVVPTPIPRIFVEDFYSCIAHKWRGLAKRLNVCGATMLVRNMHTIAPIVQASMSEPRGQGHVLHGLVDSKEHRMTRVCGTILAIGALLIACAAHAAPITFFYTGHLTQIASLDPASPFPDPISDDPSNPTTFSGSFTFDSLALDGIPGDPQTGSYASAGGPFGFSLALGGLIFNFGAVNIGILNNYPFPVGDQYQALYFVDPTDDNPTGIQLSVALTDLLHTAFTGDSLPLVPPALSAFTFTNFFFTDTIAGDQVEVAGVIDTLRLSVPEPATSALLVAGLLLIAWRRARESGARGA